MAQPLQTNPLPYLKGNVMSQNLTQPEEIDRILMAMAGRDTPAGAPIQDLAQLNGVACDFGCDKPVEAAAFSRGAVQHKKPAHGLPDP